MSATQADSNATTDAGVGGVDTKLETVVIPVADVDRAKDFYVRLGWRLDADFGDDKFRIVQLTPPGSACSIQFGIGLTSAAPGSAEALLVVSDIEAAHDTLADSGVDAEIFHDTSVGYNRFDPATRASGPDPERNTYASFAEFRDPDGNVWQLQEITKRLPGRIDAGTTSFSSAGDIAAALERAEQAHGVHEQRTGERDLNWPAWYAAYMVAEQSGAELPT
jgi:catechol 2,3-dioxygenase-like lactoylglutathione lyase family enzyme